MPQIDAGNFLAIGIQGLFYLLLFFFTVHALFLSYHWFTYGTSRSTSLTALATYLLGGAALFLTIATAMAFV